MRPRRCRLHPGWDAKTCCWCTGNVFLNLASRDKLYEFTTQHFKPGTEIRTKGQWQRLLKKHRATDDLTIKEILRRSEHDPDAERRKREKQKQLRGYLVDTFGRAIQEKGLNVNEPEIRREVQQIKRQLARR